MTTATHSNTTIALVILALGLLSCPMLVVHRSFGIKVSISVFTSTLVAVTLFKKVLYVIGSLCVIVPIPRR